MILYIQKQFAGKITVTQKFKYICQVLTVNGNVAANNTSFYLYYVLLCLQGKPAQLWAYNDCLRNHRNQHQWIMSCDVDEFVILNPAANTTQLPEFLQDYEDVGAIAV